MAQIRRAWQEPKKSPTTPSGKTTSRGRTTASHPREMQSRETRVLFCSGLKKPGAVVTLKLSPKGWALNNEQRIATPLRRLGIEPAPAWVRWDVPDKGHFKNTMKSVSISNRMSCHRFSPNKSHTGLHFRFEHWTPQYKLCVYWPLTLPHSPSTSNTGSSSSSSSSSMGHYNNHVPSFIQSPTQQESKKLKTSHNESDEKLG